MSDKGKEVIASLAISIVGTLVSLGLTLVGNRIVMKSAVKYEEERQKLMRKTVEA